MKAKEFFEELKKVDAVPFLSRLGDGTSIGRVRLRLDSQTHKYQSDLNQDRSFCPITAVCYNSTKKLFSPGQAEEAAALMGLSKGLTCKIISAADDYHHRSCPACGTDIFRTAISSFLVWLYRSRMLKILNLEPFSW